MAPNTEFQWDSYLKRTGVVDPQIEPIQDQRNEVIRVQAGDGRELFLKRGKQRTPDGEGSLLNEGLMYMLIQDLKILEVAPRCLLHDRENDILALESLAGLTVRNLWSAVEESPTFWAGLGVLLARLHQGALSYPEWAGRLLGRFDQLVPSAKALRKEDLIASTAGQLQAIRTLQADMVVGARLIELSDPVELTLIHGDARLDNFVAHADESIRLVDFELSRVGDPLYDLGTLLGSILEEISLASPPGDEEKASQFIERTVERSYSRVRSVIAGYRATTRRASPEPLESERFLSRLAAFVGVYMLHRAGALAHHLYGETRAGRFFAIMGCAFIKNPATLLRPLGLDASYFWFLRESEGK